MSHILSDSGWYTALFGMQHETSYPSKLGFHEFDVSNSYCEYVVEHAAEWLTAPPEQPFLLTAGFFETHRPYPRDRYQPATADDVEAVHDGLQRGQGHGRRCRHGIGTDHGLLVQVTAQKTFTTLFPYPGIPSTTNLNRKATIRLQ